MTPATPSAYPGAPCLVVDTIKLAEPPVSSPSPSAAAISAAAVTLLQRHRDQPQLQRSHGASPAYPDPPSSAGGAIITGGQASSAPDRTTAASIVAVETALIVRLYEPHGARGAASVTWPQGLAVEAAVLCNLLEDEEQVLTLVQAPPASCGSRETRMGVQLPFKPFQVRLDNSRVIIEARGKE